MQVIIKGSPKEIAALVVEVQGQQVSADKLKPSQDGLPIKPVTNARTVDGIKEENYYLVK